ncbi:hypothetical protein DFH08DRAFT_799740 [Mycena albidolilacea]|uniref:Uncharacterized protein n=1 Tax=Mycena albidolilacea TaxID=1033008 RepID=A0AAD7AM98_9AGAR|nr:hypothetical protein DFH08DRAFT_799740 [Mycena albidolilacea]
MQAPAAPPPPPSPFVGPHILHTSQGRTALPQFSSPVHYVGVAVVWTRPSSLLPHPHHNMDLDTTVSLARVHLALYYYTCTSSSADRLHVDSVRMVDDLEQRGAPQTKCNVLAIALGVLICSNPSTFALFLHHLSPILIPLVFQTLSHTADLGPEQFPEIHVRDLYGIDLRRHHRQCSILFWDEIDWSRINNCS